MENTPVDGTKWAGELVGEICFPTFVYSIDLEKSPIENDQLILGIRNLMIQDKCGVVRSNVGGWHSSGDLRSQMDCERLVLELIKIADAIGRLMCVAKRSHPIIDRMWANVAAPGAYSRYHVHPGSVLAAVYYVQVSPGSGRLIVHDPRAQAILCAPPSENLRRELRGTIAFDPVPGRWLIFPAWLAHEVEMNRSTCDGEGALRISIAANISFKGC